MRSSLDRWLPLLRYGRARAVMRRRARRYAALILMGGARLDRHS
jgi:hypothetical protein